MTYRLFRFALAFAAALLATNAFAWGPDGHHTVGAIADRLIAGTEAEARVKALLGGLTLEQAAVWTDCAKGVDPTKGFAYTATGKYAECAIYETPDGEAEMIDFVRRSRNDTNCVRVPGDESCHKQYHYTDEAVGHSRYHLGDVGTRDFDVVAAISATLHVLAGEPAPAPFDIKGQREALLLLAHYVGDVHQPLHVGAVYLDAGGDVVDPDQGAFDPSTSTRGGNQITTIHVATNRRSENFHATWDDIPEAVQSSHIDAKWIAQARKVRPSSGSIYGWSAVWAGGTLKQARAAVKGLNFRPETNGFWTVPLSGRYDDSMAPIKKRQLITAGARLAQALTAVWSRPAVVSGVAATTRSTSTLTAMDILARRRRGSAC